MNKKVFFNVTLGVAVAGMLLLSGCGKDNNNPDNNFTYNDNTYDLTQGLIMNDTIVDGVYAHFVILLSDGFTPYWHTNNGLNYLDSIKGKGEAVMYYLFSDGPGGPADGSYSHLPNDKSFSDVPELFTWASGKIFIDYSESDEGHVGDKYDMVDGVIQVRNTGTHKYEFKLDVTSEEQKKLKAYANMELTPIVIENKKSLNLNSLIK